MLKASALYMAIVVSLLIAVVCSALLVAAYLYKSHYQAKFRTDQLQNNINSGIAILLNSKDSVYNAGRTFGLFNTNTDSVSLKKTPWGMMDVCNVMAFINHDTLYKVFSSANNIDSARWAALYLIDEDRPLSVSGATRITGDAFIPKAGIRPAYVDNKSYTGDKQIIKGATRESNRKLPLLSESRIAYLKTQFDHAFRETELPLRSDSITNSFLKPPMIFSFGKEVKTISDRFLTGNIILHSDTTIVIDSTAQLEHIMVFAKGISVKHGFRGECQLFATDSINIERNCHFAYPSCLGVLRFSTGNTVGQSSMLNLGEKSTFAGLIFSYQKDTRQLPVVISLGKKTTVEGQVYSTGIVKLQQGATVHGSIFTNRFLYQSEFTKYENYLIDVTLDSKALSPHYLSSDLLPVAGKQKKILQWLETN